MHNYQSSTRLERLLLLLENASTPVTRAETARQLGQVQQKQPQELNYLLSRISKEYLGHNDWDTRITSADAIEAICANLPNEIEITKQEPTKMGPPVLLTMVNFSIDHIIATGAPLMACSEDDFVDDLDDFAALGFVSRDAFLDAKRIQMEKRLGLGGLPGLDSTSIGVTNSDLNNGGSCNEPPLKRQKTPKIESQVHLRDLFESPPALGSQQWPLEWFYTRVRVGLGSQIWGQRHGAACAIRAILRQSDKAFHHLTTEERERWLVDVALRLVTLLYLDRFGDFVSDSVVAPIRETAAQALGIVGKLVSKEMVQLIIEHLSLLVKSGMASRGTLEQESQIWPIRHGGLLGLRWIFAVDIKLLEYNFSFLFQLLNSALEDFSDDCRQVAAMILTPCVEFICREHSRFAIELGRVCWRNIKQSDDLTVSTASAVTLLSSLMNHGKEEVVCGSVGQDASVVIPALLPLIVHNLSSVREATMESINAMLGYGSTLHIDTVLQDTLNRTFYTVLVEHPKSKLSKCAVQIWCRAIIAGSDQLVHEICAANLNLWNALASTRDLRPVDPKLISILKEQNLTDETIFMGGQDDLNVIAETRYVLCHMLSEIFVKLGPQLYPKLEDMIGMRSEEGYQRLLGTEIIYLLKRKGISVDQFLPLLFQQLSSSIVFQELRGPLAALQMSIKKLGQHSSTDFGNDLISPYQAQQLAKGIPNPNPDQRVIIAEIDELSHQIEDIKQALSSSLNAFGGATLLLCEFIPEQKLNPIVKPLLESTRNCSNKFTRDILANAFCALLEIAKNFQSNFTPKLLKSLVTSCICDHSFLPKLTSPNSIFTEDDLEYFRLCGADTDFSTPEPILSYFTNLKSSIRSSKAKDKKKITNLEACRDRRALTYRRLSAGHILTSFVLHYRHELPQQLPLFWAQLSQLPLPQEDAITEDFINQLYLIINIGPECFRFPELSPPMHQLMQTMLRLASYSSCVIRHLVSIFIGKSCVISPVPIVDKIFDNLVDMLNGRHDFARKGAIEIVAQIVNSLKDDILPFTVIFMVPVLKVMSSQDFFVRQVAAGVFAKLLKAMPLEEQFSSTNSRLTPKLASNREQSRTFLAQLFDNSKCDDFAIPISYATKLRPYQQEGVNWLMFLNKFGLHGILSDEMGLGKTLQTILAVASDHHLRQVNEERQLKSIIISPPSVTGHWFEEVQKFVPNTLKMIHYHGNGQERRKLRNEFDHYNVVVASYEVVRNDIDFFCTFQWNYCVLDEGHVIRNTKTKVSQSIRQLRADHRVMLTGTPIQNSATELWSLFDFLMPGFLGTEKEFNSVYGRPIQNSRDPRCKNPEAGLLALQSLHRQCLPFMLRRCKSDVLKDLPPKIIQDFYCELSPIQKRLYEDFARSKAKKTIEQTLEDGHSEARPDKSEKVGHIFQAIQYLQKLCNHPALVLTRNHPEYDVITRELAKNGSHLHDLEHAPKIKALRHLLTECGIGAANNVVSEHRALIFCQHKSMLDIIEQDLFAATMPSVSFSRLDGSVPAGNRHGIVSTFNRDPTIDVLLLTTKVGGLGLNLTGADVVIFVEHDWNPQMDLQAMDRAHRIGQKRTVNVYRLITKNTVEEKIMSLQRFKLSIADSVVSSDNSKMSTMSTGQLLDLFSLKKAESKVAKVQKPDGKPKSAQSIVDELGDLWDGEGYDSEFKVNEFLQKLNE